MDNKFYTGKLYKCSKCGTILISANEHKSSDSKSGKQSYCAYCDDIYQLFIRKVRPSFVKKGDLEKFKNEYTPFIYSLYPNPNIITNIDSQSSVCIKKCALFPKKDKDTINWVLSVEPQYIENVFKTKKDFFFIYSKLPSEKDYNRIFVFGIEELKKEYKKKYYSNSLGKEIVDLYPEDKFDDEIIELLSAEQ